jgi:hypothetical protein
MKLDLDPSEYLGEAAVFRFESESRPGMQHYTIKLKTGGIVCSCEGWQAHGHCKHLELVPAEKMVEVLQKWRRDNAE